MPQKTGPCRHDRRRTFVCQQEALWFPRGRNTLVDLPNIVNETSALSGTWVVKVI